MDSLFSSTESTATRSVNTTTNPHAVPLTRAVARSVGVASGGSADRPWALRIGQTCLVAWLAFGSLVGPALAQLTPEDIEALRRRGEAEGWTFTVSENEATRRPLSELCGLVEPPDWQDGTRSGPPGPGRELPPSFDWRDYGGCTPIRNQGGCGSCWAFAAIGTLECAILINEGISTDLSEQWLVSCTYAGNCGGGWHTSAYGFLVLDDREDQCGDAGAVLESDFPYVAWNAPCDCPYPHPYWMDDWARIGGSGMAPVEEIKRAILEYGPISTTVAVDGAFAGYSGGVFNACWNNGTINHAVVLVGWDDNQGTDGIWILRNSWGPGWGEGGYMRIEYECSKVGYASCYVEYRYDCNENGVADDQDIADCDGSPWCSDCNENGVPDECDIAEGVSADCNGNGVPDECDVAGATRVFVDADAAGANTGASWADALRDIHTAFCFAQNDPDIVEIWVAAGTYTPAEPAGDRSATFRLESGVALRGGFIGTETSLDQRDLSDPDGRTFLSGDLNGDDQPGLVNYDENSYHVVTGSGVDQTAVLDGFTIVGGNADGSSGIGGGMYTYAGSPTVVNCVFIGNRAAFAGGGMHTAAGGFGASFPTLSNCVFSGNSAGGYGGAISNLGEIEETLGLTLSNCSIAGNSATGTGGVFSEGQCEVTIANSVLWGNSDFDGQAESSQVFGGDLAVSYCCVQGLTGDLGGSGNIGANPNFADADGADGVAGSADDSLRLLLSSPCIDAADNDAVPADVADVDGDGDTAEPLPIDLDGNDRLVDVVLTGDTGNGTAPLVDMGAYEFPVACPGDLDGDGVIDLADLSALLANYGMASGAEYGDGDLDGDGDVDLTDLAALLAVYGITCD